MEAPGLLDFVCKKDHLSRYQDPEDDRRQIIKQGGVGTQWRWRDKQEMTPQGPTRNWVQVKGENERLTDTVQGERSKYGDMSDGG